LLAHPCALECLLAFFVYIFISIFVYQVPFLLPLQIRSLWPCVAVFCSSHPQNGWRTVSGEPVLNDDLWRQLLGAVTSRSGNVRFVHVRGHIGEVPSPTKSCGVDRVIMFDLYMVSSGRCSYGAHLSFSFVYLHFCFVILILFSASRFSVVPFFPLPFPSYPFNLRLFVFLCCIFSL
jgi:hypothetical protein